MRGTALAAAAVLLLAACGGGEKEPEAPGPGPLRVVDQYSCVQPGSPLQLGAALIQNTADIPLTIDDVRIEGGHNVELLGAELRHGRPAVDATISEAGLEPDQPLTLEVRVLDEGTSASFEAVMIDYHNVEGRFRAQGRGYLLDLRTACRR